MQANGVASGLGWSAFGALVNAIAQVVFLAVLARLLDADAYGLMAMAVIALRFASSFGQLGFAPALIQKPELRPEDTTAALLMATGIGAAMVVAMWLATPLFVAYFRAPELASVLAVLGWSLLVGTLAGLPHALLRRAGRFKAAAAVDTASYLIGFGGVGIAAAAAGWGVWSLVAATLAQQSLAAALGFALARARLAWPVPPAAFAHLWHYGSRYSLIGLLEFIFLTVETLVIGRAFGKADLGLFNRAITLTQLPAEHAVTAVNRVMFPELSRLAGDHRRLGDAFCTLLLAVGVGVAALAGGIAAAASDTVGLLLGARWADAAPIVAIVAFAVPPMFMYVVCGVTLDSVAALGPKLRLQTAALVAKTACVVAAVAWGLQGIAWALVATETLRLAFGVRLVARTLAIAPRDCWLPVAGSAVIGAAVYVAVSGVAVAAADLPLLVRCSLEAGTGLLALAATSLLLLAAAPSDAPIARHAAVRLWQARMLALLQPKAARR